MALLVSYTMRRFLANMGTDMLTSVPNNVFELAPDDIMGTLDSAMKL